MRNKFEQKISNLDQSASEVPVQQSNGTLLNFIVPTEYVDLPSKGKFYAPDHPLYCRDVIEIKQMTAKEEDILTNKSLIKKGVVVDRLIQSLLVEQDIDVESLFVGDKNAIMIAARMSAYGSDYQVTVNCVECGAKNLLDIDLFNTSVKDVEEALAESKKQNILIPHSILENGNISVTLPKTKWNVECRLLTGKDENEILKLIETKRKKDDGDDISISEQLSFIIYSLNGVPDKELVKAAINIMPAYDAKLLRKIYQKLIPNISIGKKYSCRSCGEGQELEVPFTQEFFWPK